MIHNPLQGQTASQNPVPKIPVLKSEPTFMYFIMEIFTHAIDIGATMNVSLVKAASVLFTACEGGCEMTRRPVFLQN